MAEEIAADYLTAIARVVEAITPVLNHDVYGLTFDIGEIHFVVEGEDAGYTLVNHDDALWLRIGGDV